MKLSKAQIRALKTIRDEGGRVQSFKIDYRTIDSGALVRLGLVRNERITKDTSWGGKEIESFLILTDEGRAALESAE